MPQPVRVVGSYLTLLALTACRPDTATTDGGAAPPRAVVSAAATASSAVGPRVVLYDSAVSGPQAGVRTHFDDAEGPRVFAPLFPRDLANDTLCSGKSLTPADARAVGQFAPALLAEASGGFTRAKATQTLEIVVRNECGTTASDPTASKVAAIFEGKKLVVQVAFPSDASLVGTFDGDDDGRLELLLAYAWERDGASGVDLKSAKMDPGGVVVLRELGEVLRDGCRGGGEPRVRSTGRLFGVGAKGKLELVIERDPRPCR